MSKSEEIMTNFMQKLYSDELKFGIGYNYKSQNNMSLKFDKKYISESRKAFISFLKDGKMFFEDVEC